MSDGDISTVMPVIERYNMLMKCKNLGIAVPASSMTPEELDLVHDFYTELETVRNKKKG